MAGARHLPNGDKRNTGPGLPEFNRGRVADCLSVASQAWTLGFLVSPFLSRFLLEDQLLSLWMEPATWPLKDLPGFKIKDSNASHGVLLPGSRALCTPVPGTSPATWPRAAYLS